jgi:hypothetical protein
MTSPEHLAQCLRSLAAQRGAPAFDVTVVCDPAVPGIEALWPRFPGVRSVTAAPRAPLGLASRALKECRGDLILLTKDHCVPGPEWVRTMAGAQGPGRAVVGGRVELAPGSSATDWAFYFIDFHRYAAPVTEGATSSLTVCNVSYQRSRLEVIRDLWDDSFVESAVNAALEARFGSLWMEPASEVTMHRHLTLHEAIAERYAFGRLFGSSRLHTSGRGRRLALALFGPALPLLLLARMVRTALRSRANAAALTRAFVPLTMMILGRSWGEWLAYLTGRPPRRSTLPH